MPHNRIILHTIKLQGVPLQIPVADLTHGLSGPTIFITGGMDGDEYTGIRAAYELIEYYSKEKFPGRIIILPIVNVAGFYDGKSLNPLDGKYPKYIFPGNENGTVTEQLMYWVNKNYLNNTSLWIDLHSGAITERLRPFVWGFETRNKNVNEMTKTILTALDSDINVYEKAPFLSKAARLASKNCAYLVFERGELGEQKKGEIDKMASWVKKAINVVNGEKVKKKNVAWYEKVKYYRAPFGGMWMPSVDPAVVKKGEVGGTLQTLDKSKTEKITLKESGEILWMKSTLFAKKGDELMVIAKSKVRV